MVVDYFQHREIVAQTDFVVVHVVGRGHLEAAGAEIHLHIAIFYNWYFLVDQRNKHLLPTQVTVTLIGRIDAYCSIRHNGLRTRGCNYKEVVGRIALAVGDEIAQVVEVALGVLVNHLVIAHGGEGDRIPVDHAHSPVYPTLAVEVAEGGNDSLGELRLHGEAGTVPVAGGAEFAQLLEYDAAMLFLPFPGVLEELLPGKVFLPYAHILEPGDHLGLGGYARVVGARHPASVLAVHTRFSYQHVVERVVEHVAHMKYAGHIWRRNHDGIRFASVRF